MIKMMEDGAMLLPWKQTRALSPSGSGHQTAAIFSRKEIQESSISAESKQPFNPQAVLLPQLRPSPLPPSIPPSLRQSNVLKQLQDGLFSWGFCNF